MAANTWGVCTSFKAELLEGLHAFGPGTNVPARTSGTADTFYGALFNANSSLSPTTVTAYSTTDEVSGTGYTAGGEQITFSIIPVTDTANNAAELDPNSGGGGSISWSGMTASSFDTLLLYNKTQSDRAVALFDLGTQSITAGTLTLTFPTAGHGTSLLVIS